MDPRNWRMHAARLRRGCGGEGRRPPPEMLAEDRSGCIGSPSHGSRSRLAQPDRCPRTRQWCALRMASTRCHTHHGHGGSLCERLGGRKSVSRYGAYAEATNVGI